MPASYRIFPQHRLIYIRYTGRLKRADVVAARRAAMADAAFDATFDVLIDTREGTVFELAEHEIAALARGNVMGPAARRALVAASPLMFGLGRMFEAHSSSVRGAGPVEVFATLSQALEWLGIANLDLS